MTMLESIQNPKELTELMKLAALVGTKTVLEIGAGPCGTAVYFSDMVGEEGLVVSVDLPLDMGGTPQDYEDAAKEKAKNWKLVRGDSASEETLQAVIEALEGRSVDLMFIDGDHSQESVRRDYGLYRPLVKERGVIAFHDITLPEIWSYWCYLRGKRHPRWSFEFIEDKEVVGLGIGALIGRDEDL